MAEPLQIDFAPLSTPPSGALVLLAGQELALGPATRGFDERMKGGLMRAARAADFAGKAKTAIEVLAPVGLDTGRLVLIGTGRAPKELDRLMIGGYAFAQISARKGDTATLIAEPADAGETTPEGLAADLALGALLRSYTFKKYVTRKPGENGTEEEPSRDGLRKLVILCAKPEAAAKAFAARKAVAEGVFLARDLVNEPANMLGPVEFAERMRDLSRAGLEVEVLDEEQLKALKMGALLAVGQGSERPSRVVVLQWHGAKSKRAKTLCFVGKGVCFDTGGISMKPAAGMEDMKGDMGGAACVAGLMLALATRKAAVNAVGLIGLTENMPSGKAQRPGDIVTSMSGQTIEVLNTDAEGRLVLADVLWYAQERFKPRFIVDLATLTGAIVVALGKEYAGLFANDDKLAGEIAAAGEATGEKVWRMPLAKAYDKLIDSKNADMKNIGGRHAGAITGAQFVQRFIKDTPWAHIDVAGTAMDSGRNDLNQSWGSGWGVRLLDRLVADNYERGDK
ncbi:MAG TPA: leucyl aminopeptidase [Hyphomicrobiaceae bacterium]|nr:leucyl aminopeptidase [Hyphomicrobiaceae bacterium]